MYVDKDSRRRFIKAAGQPDRHTDSQTETEPPESGEIAPPNRTTRTISSRDPNLVPNICILKWIDV